MNLHILPKVLSIYEILKQNDYQTFFVGGSVRDMLLDKPVKDWDITTNATPDEILKLFPDAFYDNTFGTVGIPVIMNDGANALLDSSPSAQNDKIIVEVTTFRSESEYKDRRHPEKVEWGKTIEEDLKRRDFTINAIAMYLGKSDGGVARAEDPHRAPATPVRTSDGGSKRQDHATYILTDPFNGKEDLKNKVIRAVGNPNQRFKEDALRLMRAIRFATQLAFRIDQETLTAIKTDASLLEHISKERIKDELLKILASSNAYLGMQMLIDTGLMQYIIPELLEGIGMSQVRPGRHHTADVFTHNMLALKFTPATDPIVKLATLIHDVGKPRVQGEDHEGLVIFHNHEIIGANMAKEIADRLRLSKKDKEKLYMLIRWHMFTVDEHITDAAVRRFIRRVGVANVQDMIDLRIGDRLGSGTQTAESWRLKNFKGRILEQLQPEPFGLKDLVVNGNDVMKELNIKPSRKVGEILQKLFEEVDEDLSKNDKEYLLKRAHNY